MNRLWQFEQVYEQNAQTIVDLGHRAEWIILNYGSTDDLHQFILRKDLPIGLQYWRDISPTAWHASKAKNMAHRLGTGDWLANLDADNLIGDWPTHIAKSKAAVVHHWSGIQGDGTYGRIAIRAKQFKAVGGYDEGFMPMGHQDGDLLQRVQYYDLKNTIDTPQCDTALALKNTKEQAVEHCGMGWASWEDMDAENRLMSGRNLAACRFVANAGREWGLSQTLERFR